MSTVDQMKMYWRFARGLRGFLKEPITLEQSRSTIEMRHRDRSRHLLMLVKKAVYENQASPYLKLLDLAGCEYGDFEGGVKADGIEVTLQKLAAQGVYLSLEEFKGKAPVKRSGKLFEFQESDFDNPFLCGHLESYSNASRSGGSRTIYDFDYLAANRSVYMVSMLDAYGVLGAPFATWQPIMPGAGPSFLLSIAKADKAPLRWFSPVQRRGFKPSFKNRLGTGFIVYAGRLWGAKLPNPEYISLDDAWRIAEWMAGELNRYRCCRLHTYTSLAVRVSQAARARGIGLAGAMFFVSGEPVTEAKIKEISSVGATVRPIYVFAEGGMVGAGCCNPTAPDDMHFFNDSFALIQHLRDVPFADMSIKAFLFSSLLPSAPKILLNVESGDWGVMTNRSCGCKFEELGFTEHIHNIRGFDKLTGEGMTFIGTDLVRIIEEVLPARFGGASTDYQMVEEEDNQGRTRLNLIASPELGVINEAELIETVLTEIRKGPDTQRMMAEVWAQAKTLRVKRAQPFATARGKLMPLHIDHKKGN